jgi:hypothetical protein
VDPSNSPAGSGPRNTPDSPDVAPAGSKTSRLTRRAFLRTAAAGGVALGAGSLAGYWAAENVFRQASAAGPAPSGSDVSPVPSQTTSMRSFRSRPDLTAPLVSVTTPGLRVAPGLIMLTPAGGPGPMLVDDAGSPIWIHPTPGKRAFNLRLGTYQGEPVLSWFEGSVVNGTGLGNYVLVDGSYRQVALVQAGDGLQGDLHEFIARPDGTAFFTAYAERLAPGQPGLTLKDSVAQAIDIESGVVVFEWHASDHVSTAESYNSPSAGQPFDFFHINSIDVEPDGNLLISARHTWTVYKIDRQSGAVIWRLGGKQSDFQMGPGAAFAWQHDARRQPDGSITLFDDGSNGVGQPAEPQSRGLILDVDETRFTATLRRAYTHPGILAGSQGSMQILPDGNVFVGWGQRPNYTEYEPDGTVALDASTADAYNSYRSLRFPWVGRPTEAPAVAMDPVGGNETVVYASWNGATGVAVWLVLGGDTLDSLQPVASHPRTGFETEIVVPGNPRVVVAEALGGSGEVLGKSIPAGATSSG